MANTFNHNDKVVITDGGNVGIGTTSPSEKLEVAGNLKIQANATNAISFKNDGAFTSMYSDAVLRIYQRVEVWGGGAGKQYLDVRDTSGNVKIMLNATDNSYFASNNVGIGTTSPDGKLDIRGNYGRWRINGYGGMYFRNDSDTGYTRYIHPRSDGTLSFGRIADTDISGTAPDGFAASSYDQFYLDASGTAVFNGGISFPGVNGANFVVDTDAQRIVWEHQRNGTRKMTFYHETDADTFNFSFASGNNLQINGNRIVTANELGTAAASAATDFVAVSGDTMSGDLNMGSNDIKAVNSIVLNNVEGSSFGTVNGTLIFDENFYGDTEYGTAWAGGNGGGLAVYGEDGWNRMLSDKNAQWFLGTAAFSRSDDFVAVTGDTMTGNLLLNNGVEILSNDTGGTARTIMRVTSGNVLQYGWSGSGAVQFMGGGSYTERMRIHTDGNIGIGTTSPASKLQVNVGTDQNVAINSTGGVARISAYDDAVANSVPLIINGSNLRFTNNTSEAVRITGGNVGIGTTSPQKKLDVRGGYFMTNDGSGKESAFVQGGTGYAYFGNLNAGPAAFGNSENWTTLVADGGNVGIGTTSPTFKLDVVTGGDASVMRLLGSAGNQTYFGFDGGGGYIETNGASTARQKLRFQSYNGSAYTQLFIDGGNQYIYTSSNVNVGIGTTSPDVKLHVNSAGTLNSQEIVLGLSSTSQRPMIQFSESAVVATGNGMSIEYDGRLSSGNNKMYINGVDNSPKLTVMAGGNVGIGTTSPDKKLVVAASSQTWGGAPQIAFYDTTSGQTGARNWTVGAISTSWGNFTIASSSAAGGDPTTARLTITNAGNVGIGTTNPTYKLQVNGTAYINETLYVNGETTFDGTSNFNTNIVNASAPYASGDEYIKITNPNDNSGTLMVASNGNTWLNADGGKDLWLNWYSLNSASSKADLRVGDGYGGTLMSVIGSSGNVGIGTTSPSQKLEVVGDIRIGQNSAIRFNTSGSSNDPGLAMLSDASFVFYNTASSTTLKITNGGNVGIGTTSPAYKLDVSGDIRATGDVISGGQQLVIPAVGRFLFDSTTDYNTATEGSIAISTEGAIQGGDNTVYTINERDITFNESGFYKISVYITYTSTTQRANPGIRLKKNNTDYISPWGLSGYLRYASGHNEASNFVDTIAYFDENDYVEVYTKAFAASGTCTDDGSGSHILIERIAM